jgi:segregation and condensation protein B
MDASQHAGIKRDLEALLFASGDPLAVETILQALGLTGPASTAAVEGVLEGLAAEFPPGGARGFELVHVAGGWTFRSNPVSRAAVSALFELPEDASRLSSAAMECLTVIAYLQPVSRPQIAEIRGVNSDSPVRTLLDRELVTEVGRSQNGGALLYGTTTRFEAMFGLGSIDELPELEGFALGEEQKDELRRRLGVLSVAE